MKSLGLRSSNLLRTKNGGRSDGSSGGSSGGGPALATSTVNEMAPTSVPSASQADAVRGDDVAALPSAPGAAAPFNQYAVRARAASEKLTSSTSAETLLTGHRGARRGTVPGLPARSVPHSVSTSGFDVVSALPTTDSIEESEEGITSTDQYSSTEGIMREPKLPRRQFNSSRDSPFYTPSHSREAMATSLETRGAGLVNGTAAPTLHQLLSPALTTGPKGRRMSSGDVVLPSFDRVRHRPSLGGLPSSSRESMRSTDLSESKGGLVRGVAAHKPGVLTYQHQLSRLATTSHTPDDDESPDAPESLPSGPEQLEERGDEPVPTVTHDQIAETESHPALEPEQPLSGSAAPKRTVTRLMDDTFRSYSMDGPRKGNDTEVVNKTNITMSVMIPPPDPSAHSDPLANGIRLTASSDHPTATSIYHPASVGHSSHLSNDSGDDHFLSFHKLSTASPLVFVPNTSPKINVDIPSSNLDLPAGFASLLPTYAGPSVDVVPSMTVSDDPMAVQPLAITVMSPPLESDPYRPASVTPNAICVNVVAPSVIVESDSSHGTSHGTLTTSSQGGSHAALTVHLDAGQDTNASSSSISLNLDEPMSPFQMHDVELREPVFAHVTTSATTPLRAKVAMKKFNSCSTLNLPAGTPTRSDLAATVRMVASAIHDLIQEAHRARQFRSHRLFHEDVYPLSVRNYLARFAKATVMSHPSVPPAFETINFFLLTLFEAAQLGSDICVITLIYLERILCNTRINIYSANWARLTLGALLLASKVWDDQAVWNIDFCTVFPDAKVKDLNDMERFFIEGVHFNVTVKATTYLRYYFALHDRFGSAGSAKPLSVRDAIKCEAVTLAAQQHQFPTLTVPVAGAAASMSDLVASASPPPPAVGPITVPPDDVVLRGLTGIRRVRSDYLVVPNVPASIM
ncbi:hypothetical protein AMAG_01246 [Allomyces macrogynus ATCC 38327]|uniref:Cyclin-like domain-containing protein n=1 Tax=Allomyces macrogynus (strain ATCC 38327) TaxID=578462 RepID=A0A0L0RYW3_ALLM3|nr:hypothetical protein AMAG_01246 [Allomyces macrogynus ATCC 38327]|eukprot:KNE55345.1 hypothetical protein AMAG_01246 [Allomyces macrogynus ATCC 38327]